MGGGKQYTKKVNVIPINTHRSTLKVKVWKATRQDGHDGHSLSRLPGDSYHTFAFLSVLSSFSAMMWFLFVG